jgi:hypothetical protein
MKDLPQELLYGLMFLAVVLFQYLMKRFGPQEPLKPVLDELPEQGPDGTDATLAASAASSMAGADSGQLVRNDAPRRRRFSRGALMGSRREMQNAVVIATILGPCRTFEPHDLRQ